MSIPNISPQLLNVIVQAIGAMLAGDSAKATRLAREAAQTAAMDAALSGKLPGKKR